MFQKWVPPAPFSIPVVSDDWNELPVTFNPLVVVRFHEYPVEGLSFNLRVMVLVGFRYTVAPLCCYVNIYRP